MKNKLTYFIARDSMFGLGFFLIFQNSGKDAWISVLLGTILGIIILYLYNLIKKNLNNNSLTETLKSTKLGIFYNFIFIIFYLYLMCIVLMLLPLFVNSFYLLTTPKLAINLPFIILAIYITFKGKEVIELAAGKYKAIIAPFLGSNVLRMQDTEADIEIMQPQAKEKRIPTARHMPCLL